MKKKNDYYTRHERFPWLAVFSSTNDPASTLFSVMQCLAIDFMLLRKITSFIIQNVIYYTVMKLKNYEFRTVTIESINSAVTKTGLQVSDVWLTSVEEQIIHDAHTNAK